MSVSDEPLSKTLRRLDLDLSFDARALSKYSLTVERSFDSPQQAIDFLLKGKPLVCEQINGVYVISQIIEPTSAERKKYVQLPVFNLYGIIRDAHSGERLPYAYISSSHATASGDVNGVFDFKLHSNNPVKLKFSYLGYHDLDTLLNLGNHNIELFPKPITLRGLTVASSSNAMLMQSGLSSGEVRVNQQVAIMMPGNADNSVFNILQLMPGVRASGEPPNNLIVWGSSMGESSVVFDGFTLYGMKGFNDNISSINPYMVKDIRLMKGGYNASQGSRVGAITEITGIDGRRYKPSFKANLSNLTANLFASAPIAKQTSLTAAYRQTFYKLYDIENLNSQGNNASSSKDKPWHGAGLRPNQSAIYILPNYRFSDGNIKLSGQVSDKDSYYISLYAADDKFDFSLLGDDNYTIDASEESRQYGSAAKYAKMWARGAISDLAISFSQLSTKTDHLQGIGGSGSGQQALKSTKLSNVMQESAIKLKHRFRPHESHQMEIGSEWMVYRSSINGLENTLLKPSLFIIDNISLKKLTISPGLRFDLRNNLLPRLSIKMPFDQWTATAAWGLYNQYISNIPIHNTSNNYQFVWQILDKPMRSMHTVAGLAYSENGFLASVEGYAKKINNAARLSIDTTYMTDINIYGIDLFLKKEIGKSLVFGSYSLASIREYSSELGQELKSGAVIALSPFYISATYIYGTGFANLSSLGHGRGQTMMGNNAIVDEDKPYSRLDLSVRYSFKLRTATMNTGLSVLNLLDTQNVKYNYMMADKNEVTSIYTSATPFTTMFFLEVIF
ncbi:TonB-dependent receptor [Bacteroidales bacterium]|nr:TonB-dependent receptor [Bacteroidales bacterium]